MKITLQEDFLSQFKKNEDIIIFLHILFNCNEDGEATTSLSKLSTSTGIGIHTVRDALKRLESAHILSHNRSHQNSVITITNSSSYIGKKKSSGHTNGHTDGHTENEAVLTPEEIAFNEWMKEKYPRVSSLPKPLKYSDMQDVLKCCPNRDIIIDVLGDMENSAVLHKKYRDAKRTLLKWIKLRLNG